VKLQDAIVLITGANRGIGNQTVWRLTNLGNTFIVELRLDLMPYNEG
jgi:NAD(P)-dependent dehydrogenase (short-subunit alcohol dehydrogenase family)